MADPQFYGNPDDIAAIAGNFPEPYHSEILKQLTENVRAGGGTLPVSPDTAADVNKFVGGEGSGGKVDKNDSVVKIMTSPEARYITQQGQTYTNNQAIQENTKQAIKDIAGVTDSDVQEVYKYIGASQAVNSIKAEFTAEQDARNAAGVRIYGTDTTAAGNVIAEEEAKMRTARAQVDALDTQIVQKKSVSFFDNPLAYIAARVTLPATIEQRNAIATQFNVAEQNQQRVIASTTAIANMDLAVKQGTATALVDSENQKIASEANIKSNLLKMEGLKLGLDGYKILASLTDADLSQSHQALMVQLEQQRAAREEQNAELMRQQRQINQVHINNLIKKEKLDANNLAEAKDDFNAGAAHFGAPQIADAHRIIQLQAKGDPVVLDYIGWGQNARTVGRNTGIPLSPSPFQTWHTLYKSQAQGTNINDANSASKFLVNVGAEAAGIADQQGKKGAVASEFIDEYIKTKSKLAQASIDPAVPNPYQAAGVKTIIDALPKALQNRFVKENISALDVQGQPTNPDLVLGAAKQVLKTDPTRFDEVVSGIAQFYRGAMYVNNGTKDYVGLNLPNQTSFNASLNSGAMWGKHTVDLTSEVNIARLLMSDYGAPSGSVFNTNPVWPK